MALRPYSVSPRLVDQTVGPKPIMYWVTLTPNFLAGTRCPISCSAMLSATPTTTTRTPRKNSTSPLSHPPPVNPIRCVPRSQVTVEHIERESGGDGPPGCGAGPGVGGEDVAEGEVADVRDRLGGIRVDDPGDGVDDVDEADAAVVERVDGDLVGGVVDGRPRAARLPHPAREGDGREGVVVERLEVPRLRPGPVDGHVGVGDPLGPAHAQGDGHEHARRPRLRDRRAVDELDHRVDHLLRVHDDVDVLERDVEEQVRLDDLEA